MSDPALAVEGLARRYGRRWALMDATFQISEGSVVMVAGRNGAGKTTLFRLLATAIRPDRGSARIVGFDVLRDRQDVRKRSALLSHESYLYESLTALENLHLVTDQLRAGRGGAMSILDQVGLTSRAGDAVSTFSAGMRKRLSFARILLQKPRVVLLDEPYGSLDPPGFELVDRVISDFKRTGVTVLLATHQWERVSRLADQAILLEEGRVLWQGPASEALAWQPREAAVLPGENR